MTGHQQREHGLLECVLDRKGDVFDRLMALGTLRDRLVKEEAKLLADLHKLREPPSAPRPDEVAAASQLEDVEAS